MNEKLQKVLENLSPEQQSRILEFAEMMLEHDISPQDVIFYINCYTFEVSEQFPDHDLQNVVPCFDCDDEDLFKPLTDESGQLVTRAPRWFVEMASKQQKAR